MNDGVVSKQTLFKMKAKKRKIAQILSRNNLYRWVNKLETIQERNNPYDAQIDDANEETKTKIYSLCPLIHR